MGITHQTIEADRDLLVREPRLDLILGGHEHEAHDSVVSGRHVLKADANSRTAQFVTVWGGKGEWRQAVGLVHIDSRLPDDSLVAPVVKAWEDSLRAAARARANTRPAPPSPSTRGTPSAGRRESLLGDLVTDAMRAGTGTDVALLNAGTLRLDDVIKPGPITNYQLESIFLFSDETRVITFQLTGARLREILEHGVADGSLGKGPFLQVSGRGLHLRPGRTLRSADRRKPQSPGVGGADPADRYIARWRSRCIRRAKGETATTCPRRRQGATTGHRRPARWTCCRRTSPIRWAEP